MLNKPLVSIIIPCYNGEKIISGMLDSIIAQTYRPIELIIVNDGSTDNSEAVIKDYEEKFKNADIALKYVHQDNQGLGGAINTGLKHFTGDYLCWADIDDYYTEDSVELRVEFLESHPEYAVVTSDADILLEDSLDKVHSKVSVGINHNNDENQFWHAIQADSIFCAGCHMFRVADFLKVNPNRSVYPARRGQNWQMLLPMYYNYKRYFFDKSLYKYVIYKNSMSKDFSYAQELERAEEHQKIIIETLSNIDMTEEDFQKAEKLVKTSYAKRILRLSSKNGDRKTAKESMRVLKTYNAVTIRNKIEFILLYFPFVWKILKK